MKNGVKMFEILEFDSNCDCNLSLNKNSNSYCNCSLNKTRMTTPSQAWNTF